MHAVSRYTLLLLLALFAFSAFSNVQAFASSHDERLQEKMIILSHVEGKPIEEALAYIRNETPDLEVEIIRQGSVIASAFRSNRVRVYVIKDGTVSLRIG